ncbi:MULTISPECIES: LPS export ABC transporter periplasmic protein LptC [Pseudomonadati]|uniref:Lipopolysaccharide export system protein LptC n=1 Tax=Shewanella aestuarii TaxID=1028752 RepID=A0ABT0KZE2_9GAMM|nr:LPS export ABC transporter periplasmic protein LptC [Shewanella aestuarii]MCL1116557.1 LPS export ABC transporter periplasmic protein LptC [Shewanella aestuarii]GGN72073.1 lipopolysaccharide export system protein LptC [Shewanella aestuarii]
MNRTTLAICAFFGLALVLYWQVQIKRSEMALVVDTRIERPDFVADELHTTEFNKQGFVDSKMSAKHMEHFSTSNTTLFTEPVLLLYPQNGEAKWQITAEKATLEQNANQVSLHNDVIIDAIDIEEPLQSLETQQVTFNLDTMIGRSEEPVIIKGNGFLITGLGLFADLNAEEITLLSQVEGTYEPH